MIKFHVKEYKKILLQGFWKSSYHGPKSCHTLDVEVVQILQYFFQDLKILNGGPVGLLMKGLAKQTCRSKLGSLRDSLSISRRLEEILK